MRLTLVGALIGVWASHAAAETLVIRDVVTNLPAGWRFEKPAKAEEPMQLSIALKQPRINELKTRLNRISDPRHAEYGHHLTRDEVKDYQAPDRKTLDLVHSWLRSNRITNITNEGSMVKFTSTAAEVNRILRTNLGYYSFQDSSPFIRTQSYALPRILDGNIEFIYPISNFMPPPQSRLKHRPSQKAAFKASDDDQPCLSGVTPACLKKLYNVTYADTKTPIESPVRIGIAGFLEQWIKYDDVSEFLGRYSPELEPLNYNFTVVTLNNGTNPQPNAPESRAGLEASLDVEYAMALAYPANVIYYSTGGRGEKVDREGELMPSNRSDNEPYLEFFQYLLDLKDEEIPHVISISYADDEQSVPAPYAARVCDLLALVAARGITVLSGSGDGGAGGIGQNQCYSNDGRRRKIFLPTFPASCPYVTAVGATGNTLPLEGADFSTGGFSNYFARPEWQKSVVDEYISTLNGSHRGLYNASGRAFPDISATGTNYVIQVGGYQTDVLGTSASTPVVAALVALINDSRLKAGKNSTGWLNPALYSQPVREALQDITTGVSQNCVFDDAKEPGWKSVKGYDCVTGLGSVAFSMTILQVTPTSSELLQDVANSLGKARKVVIITGAGISTNSGIPDFRSENGLYSLIQAQFERAEAGHSKDNEGQTVDFAISERPTKRRRISHTNERIAEQHKPTKATDGSDSQKAQDGANILVGGTDEDTVILVRSTRDTLVKQEAVASGISLQRLTRSQSGLRPPLPRHASQYSVQSSTSQESLFSGSRLSRTSAVLGKVFSSSPLSSPPPVLFDPYENANSSTEGSSRESAESSEASDLEDTQNSLDLLSSQTSNSSLRNMKGRDLFDCNIWADPLKTSVFYRFATTLRQKVKEVEPTTTHRFIAQLRDVGKLARVYTQNIDEIEKKIGLSTDLKSGAGNKRRKSAKQQLADLEKDSKENLEASKDEDEPNVDVGQASQGSETSGRNITRSILAQDKGVECVFLHGSLHALRCFVCGKLCDWDEDGRESCTMSGEQPECPHCAGATAARQEKGKRALGIGKLRPDIVLYGEEHPQSDLISPIVQHDLSVGPDLLLILGTSLKVHGLKVMVKEFAKAVHNKGGKVIFINLTRPSDSAWGDIIDYWIEWDCDAWVDDLKDRKPHLWLSPDEILESEKQRREALAEKKRETISKKRESLGEKRRHTIEFAKPRPPPKNPSSMRNDYQCGAYVVWEIFQTLAKIGDRPFDNLGYTLPCRPPPAVPPPIPSHPTPVSQTIVPTTKSRKPRKSAPAALVSSTTNAGGDPEIKFGPANKGTFLANCNSRKQYEKAAQELARSGKSPTPIRLAELNRSATPHRKSATPPPYEPLSSITAAVKINPRRRKRKMIEGIPVGGTVSRTKKPAPPRSTPGHNLKGANGTENGLSPSTNCRALPSKGPVLPPFHPGWERSPPARIKPLEPSLNVSPPSPLSDLPPIARPRIFAIRQATYPMLFSNPLNKLRYETTNYRRPPKESSVGAYDKPPSPSDQLRWELAQQEALEGAQVLEGLKYSR
ncbi:DHS-like NAD/FAD-binding domain-containing protein [Daldinia vernicosa]|uniref:DHS-like NAD/FAD-binding domain-containing protein n=1 Tax=Daldinia vernicosa TaxID=114800 RepID=UPI0020084864|nr:DHS-like NAD/FAD-binding domain-containing protein [Daldinia vernicosa]KAI0846666.1 DHS-like NAD/FAD-binding domain-containing protein [Daldinia vernicosa]